MPGEGEYLAIIVDALAGNDTVTVGPTVQKTVWIDGGDGDDTITIRGGNAILVDQAEYGLHNGLRGRNDFAGQAFPLPLPTSGDDVTVTGLTLDSPTDVDWYEFTLGSAPLVGASIELAKASRDDDLTMSLFRAADPVETVQQVIGAEPSVVAHYRFDEQTGPIVDSIGGRNGLLSGDAERVEGGLLDGGGRSFSADGINGQVSVPYDIALNPTDLTVEAWVKVTGGEGTWRSVITSRTGSGGGGLKEGFNIYAGIDDRWQFWTGDGTWQQLVGPAVELNRWHHIVATFDSVTGTKRLYINGVPTESMSQGYTPMQLGTVNPLTIGAGGSTGETFFWPGQIDEVAIYSEALSSASVAEHFDAGNGRFLQSSKTGSLDLSVLDANDTYLLQVESNQTPTLYDLRFNLDGQLSVSGETIDLGSRTDSIRRDVILGGNGDDILMGGAGEDWIFGGPGRDVLSGGLDRQASDLIFAGPGDDTFQIIPDYLPQLGNQTNTLFETGDATFIPTYNDQLFGQEGTDRVLFLGGDFDRRGFAVPDYAALRYNTGLHRYEFSSLVWDIGQQEFRKQKDRSNRTVYEQQYLYYQTHDVEQTQILTRAGNDTFRADTGFKFFPISGSFNANLYTGWGIDEGDMEQQAVEAALLIDGGDDNDQLFGGAYADLIRGGDGDDKIFGGRGDDQLLGGPGEDEIFGNTGPSNAYPFNPIAAPETFEPEIFQFELAAPLFGIVADTSRPGIKLNEGGIQNVADAFGIGGTTVGERLDRLQRIGDFNQDGIDDYISSGQTFSYIFLGPVALDDMQDATQIADYKIDSSVFGIPAKNHGDVNGDGFADLLFLKSTPDQTIGRIVFGRTTDTYKSYVWDQEFIDSTLTQDNSRTISLDDAILSPMNVQAEFLRYTADQFDDILVSSSTNTGTLIPDYVDPLDPNSKIPGTLPDINAPGNQFTEFDGKVFFPVFNGLGVFDGTTTRVLKLGSAASPVSISPQQIVAAGDRLWFVAELGGASFLFFVDRGTEQIRRMSENSFSVFGSARIAKAIGHLYSSPSVSDVEQFRPQGLVGVGNHLYFSLRARVNGAYETHVFRMPSNAPVNNTNLSNDFLVAVAKANTGNGPSDPVVESITDGSRAFFIMDGFTGSAGNGPVSGKEVWQFTGESFTVLDATPGSVGSSPEDMVVDGDVLYFTATNADDHGKEVWRYSNEAGSEDSEPVALDLVFGFGGSAPTDLAAHDGTVYVSAHASNEGPQLWTIDGVTGSANRVTNLNYDTDGDGDVDGNDRGTAPTNFFIYDDDLIFAANDDLMRFDGAQAAVLAHDVVGNSVGTTIQARPLFAFNDALYVMQRQQLTNAHNADYVYEYAERSLAYVLDGKSILENAAEPIDQRNAVLRVEQPIDVAAATDARVINAGDIDGNGLDELLLSDSGRNLRAIIPGGHYGRTLAGRNSLVNDTSRVGVPVNLGDLNSDGFHEFGWLNASELQVFSGGALDSISFGSPAAAISGGSVTIHEAMGGDFNGDRLGDLVVSHSTASDGTNLSVYQSVLNGGASSRVLGLAAESATQAFGIFPHSRAFDLNQDFIDDIVVSAPGVDTIVGGDRQSDAGRNYVIFGQGQTLTIDESFVDLSNISIPGSGGFVSDPGTGRNIVFANGSAPFDLPTGDRWFRFTTLGDGVAGNVLLLSRTDDPDNPVVGELVNELGEVVYNDQSAFDLRRLEAGTYFVRVRGPINSQFEIEMVAPMRGDDHESSLLPDRDHIEGGDGDDILTGNQDFDRLFGGSGEDTFVAEPYEIKDLRDPETNSNVPAFSDLGAQASRTDIDPIVDDLNAGPIQQAIYTALGRSATSQVIDPISAQYLRIENNDSASRQLQIGEIEVFSIGSTPTASLDPLNDLALITNGAFPAATTGGGTLAGNVLVAINGATDGEQLHINNASNNSITISLGGTFPIGEVRVWNADDGDAANLMDFTVTLFADDGNGDIGDVIWSETFAASVPAGSAATFDLRMPQFNVAGPAPRASELGTIASLDLTGLGIENLDGVERLLNLRALDLSGGNLPVNHFQPSSHDLTTIQNITANVPLRARGIAAGLNSAYVVDDLRDNVYAYTRNADTGHLTLDQTLNLPEFAEVNSVAIHPNQRFVFFGDDRFSNTATLVVLDTLTNELLEVALGSNVLQVEKDGQRLLSIKSITFSPDGEHVYLSGYDFLREAIAHLSFDPSSGAMMLVSVERTSASRQLSPSDVIMSNDGRNVYAATGAGVVVMDRNLADGTLVEKGTGDSPAGGDSGEGLGLTRDQRHVYAVLGNTVRVFERDLIDGTLTQLASYGTGDIPTLEPSAVIVPNDGNHVFVGNGDNEILVFSRDSATGLLTLQHTETLPQNVSRFVGSPDGTNIYAVGSQNGLVSVSRDGTPAGVWNQLIPRQELTGPAGTRQLRRLVLDGNINVNQIRPFLQFENLQSLSLQQTGILPSAPQLIEFSELTELVLPVQGIAAGQNFVGDEGMPFVINTLLPGDWTVQHSGSVVTSGSGTAIAFTANDDGGYLVTHDKTETFLVVSRNVDPNVTLPAVIDVNEGTAAPFGQIVPGLTVADVAGDLPTVNHVEVTYSDGRNLRVADVITERALALRPMKIRPKTQ